MAQVHERNYGGDILSKYQYKILRSTDPDELTRQVGEHVEQGWWAIGEHKVGVKEAVTWNNPRDGHDYTEHTLEYSWSIFKSDDKVASAISEKQEAEAVN